MHAHNPNPRPSGPPPVNQNKPGTSPAAEEAEREQADTWRLLHLIQRAADAANTARMRVDDTEYVIGVLRMIGGLYDAALSPAPADEPTIEPDMWWDPEASEECISDPYEAIEANEYIKPGDTFRLDCAKKLPSRIYTVIAEPTELDPNGISYRDATPEEVAEHEAHEKAEKVRRKAEMDAENKRRQAGQAAKADGGGA